jgi:NAD(P)-dependent dehydrogenase (short-subunit alcohol dehydrogenase family)
MSAAPSATYPDLAGKVVVITGGANGIGAAMVRAFSSQGAHVHFCDRDAAAGRELERSTERARFRACDLKDEGAVRQWLQEIGQAHGNIQALLNNAAIDPRIAFGEMTTGQWDDLFAINLRSVFWCSQAALPFLGKGSSVINFSSITWHLGPAEMSAYVASKAAVQGFTRSLARELGPRGIRINTLSPGWTMTERQLKEYVDEPTKEFIRKSQCIPDLVTPEEIAGVALFLASNASAPITGQELLADRGWTYS